MSAALISPMTPTNLDAWLWDESIVWGFFTWFRSLRPGR
jgi:hypothetical protein